MPPPTSVGAEDPPSREPDVSLRSNGSCPVASQAGKNQGGQIWTVFKLSKPCWGKYMQCEQWLHACSRILLRIEASALCTFGNGQLPQTLQKDIELYIFVHQTNIPLFWLLAPSPISFPPCWEWILTNLREARCLKIQPSQLPFLCFQLPSAPACRSSTLSPVMACFEDHASASVWGGGWLVFNH